MKTVWKYPLEVLDEQTIEIPDIHQILHIAEQHGEPTLWFLVDPGAPKIKKRIRIYGTGHTIVNDYQMTFLGSVLMSRGDLVWHIFDMGPAG
jgi:hypothetical protein